MTATQVLAFRDATPFKPFELLLADGRAIAVQHPDFATVSEDEELIHIYELPDGVEVIDLMLVISVRTPVKFAIKKQSR